jgi:hypothetical protein
MEVHDRLGEYGVVGCCVLRDGCVEALFISCRIRSLRLAIPFLSAVLRHAFVSGPITERVVEGPRNHPARNVFTEAGFTQTRPGEFVLEQISALASVDETVYEIAVLEAGAD